VVASLRTSSRRWPSALASHARTGTVRSYSPFFASKSSRGTPTRGGGPASIATEKVGSAVCVAPLNISSRPCAAHSSSLPYAVEPCVFGPGPGYGCTYTSGRPDSLEAYDSHRPSGDSSANEIAVRDSMASDGVRGDDPPIGRTYTPNVSGVGRCRKTIAFAPG